VVFAQIPTPAIAEIVSTSHYQQSAIGTELNVKHMGVLYRQTFQQGELIYHRVRCQESASGATHCQVTPIVCQKQSCSELMFLHATHAYPNHFKWYQTAAGEYVCTAKRPPAHVAYTTCNRVEARPLFDYLTDYQYGSYWYMTWPPLLGVHIEKLKIAG
jgi:hypothetical protein